MNLSWFKKSYSWLAYWTKKILWPNTNNLNHSSDLIKKQDERLVLSFSPARLPKLRQLKYIKRLFSPAEKKQVKILIVIFCISTLILTVSLIWRNTEAVARAGGIYTEATVGTPQYINPLLATANDTDLDLIRLIYSGLLKYNERLELEPDLAASYQISSDQKIYTFQLKSDLKWHDGQALTAADIIYTINTIQNPRIASPLEPSFRGVKAKQLDDDTIQFILEKPFAPFLHNLTVGIIPEHLWQNIPPQNFKLAELNLKPIGSGSWQFDSLKKDKEGNLITYSLKNFPHYYGPKPYIKNFTFKFYPDFSTARQALLDKNVDGISFLSKDKKTSLAEKKFIIIHNLQLPQYTAIFINQNKNEILQEIKVRQALAMAISKQKMVLEVFQGEAEAIAGPILPGLVGYDPNFKNAEYNLETANKLLEETGWQINPETKLRQKEDKTLSLTLTTVDFEDNIKIAEIIRQAWRQIGIEINVNIVPATSIQGQIIKPRNYELLLFGEILGPDPDLYPFWHSSQIKDPGLNLTGFVNKKADALLEQSRQTSEADTRAKLNQEFQKIIAENIPAIFLFQPTYSYPISDKIKGFNLTRINVAADRLMTNQDWYIKTTRRWVKN